MVSVVICTKDRPLDAARVVERIRTSGAAGRAAEIVVVEETETPSDIRGVHYVQLPREDRGFGHARNIGVRAARGDVVAFIDDDCDPERGWLEALTAPFAGAPGVLGVAGAVMVRDCGAIGYAENILGFPGGGVRYRHAAGGRVVPTRYLSTCNCAYRRDAILRAGGFLEDARWGGEDALLAERVSRDGPCVYAPDAVVYHRPRGRFGAIFHWFVRRGRSELAVLARTGDRTAFLTYLLRSSWTLRAAVAASVLLRWPAAAPVVPLAIGAYGAAVLWRFRFARRYPTHRRAWWLVPAVKVTMDLGAEVGRWRALLAGKP